MRCLRVLIADPLEQFRQRLRSVLETRPDTVVCAEVSDGRELVDAARDLKPDLIVAEISLAIINGLEATELIRQSDTRVIILLISLHPIHELVLEAKNAGANGFIDKMTLAGTIMGALDALLRGEPFFIGSS